MAITSANVGQQQEAEQYIKEAVRHLDGMTERERYRDTRSLLLHHRRLSGMRQGIRRSDRAISRRTRRRTTTSRCARRSCGTSRGAGGDAAGCRHPAETRALPGRIWRCTPPTAATFRPARAGGASRRELGSRWGLLALAFAQLGQGQVAQATRDLPEARKGRRARESRRRRPASATWRFMKAASRMLCEYSRKVRPPIWRPRIPTGLRPSSPCSRTRTAPARTESRGHRRRRTSAGKQQRAEDPIPDGPSLCGSRRDCQSPRRWPRAWRRSCRPSRRPTPRLSKA